MSGEEDWYSQFESPKNQDDIISSEVLLNQLSVISAVPPDPIEEKFYLQCRRKSTDVLMVSVHELGRVKIRVFGYEPFVPQAFVMDCSLEMVNIVLRGRMSAENNLFVVESKEFRDKKIEFLGTMPSIRTHEIRIKSKEDHSTMSAPSADAVDLNPESIIKLMNAVQDTCPTLINTPTTSPVKKRPVLEESLSPESLCFGDVTRQLNASLSHDLSYDMDGSDKAFVSLMDCSYPHYGQMDSSARTPPLNWTPVPSPVLSYQNTQQSSDQSARRTLCFPPNFSVQPFVPPVQNTVPKVGASNFANAMLLNNMQEVKPVRLEVVRNCGITQRRSQSTASTAAYSSVVHGNSSTSTTSTKGLKQSDLQPKGASLVPVFQSPSLSNDVVVIGTSDSNRIMYDNGVPCYSVMNSDGTSQLYVCESYFIRDVQRYEGYIDDWVFLRIDENHASYYRHEIHVDINKVMIPGRKFHEIVEGYDSELFYRIKIPIMVTKVCNSKQDVFPYFYKNSSQYKKLPDDEKAKYILCDQGPMPPFPQGTYRSHYYLKEIDCNTLSDLRMGYSYITRYYKKHDPISGEIMCPFSLEYYKEVMETIEFIDRSLGKDLAEQRKKMQLNQTQLPIPRKSQAVKKTGSVVEKKDKGKHRVSKSDENSLSEKDETEEEDVLSFNSDEYTSCSDVSMSDIESLYKSELKCKGETKENKRKKFSDEPGGFYDILKKLKKGQISFPEETKHKKSKKRDLDKPKKISPSPAASAPKRKRGWKHLK